MSGIPVYTSAPLHPTTASKPSGTTPQTAAAPQAPEPNAPASASAYIPPTSTSTASSASYPSAQPGAAPSLPAPTSAARLQSVPPPTKTTNKEDEGPAAPQPGAIPIPSSRTSEAQGAPAAQPTATAIQQPSEWQAPTLQPTDAQRGYGMPVKGSTATTTTPSFANPSTAFVSPAPAASAQSLEHPPGYVQNPYAGADYVPPSSGDGFGGVARSQSQDIGGILGGGGSGSSFGEDGSVWEGVKGWVKGAAEKASELEREVWKRALGEEDNK